MLYALLAGGAPYLVRDGHIRIQMVHRRGENQSSRDDRKRCRVVTKLHEKRRSVNSYATSVPACRWKSSEE